MTLTWGPGQPALGPLGALHARPVRALTHCDTSSGRGDLAPEKKAGTGSGGAAWGTVTSPTSQGTAGRGGEGVPVLSGHHAGSYHSLSAFLLPWV